jgi:activator of HSP90 ATPase
MTTARVSRRDFWLRLAALAAAPVAASSVLPAWLRAEVPEPIPGELSTHAESIHQVLTFDAPPARVYETLVDPVQFSAMTRFSTVPKAAPARLTREVGAAFALFDGHIAGRNVELVADRRIVQAWRATDWEDGLYSIARFELAAQGPRTIVTFDHTGFPKGQGAHLVEGWYANYWTPMKKHLG